MGVGQQRRAASDDTRSDLREHSARADERASDDACPKYADLDRPACDSNHHCNHRACDHFRGSYPCADGCPGHGYSVVNPTTRFARGHDGKSGIAAERGRGLAHHLVRDLWRHRAGIGRVAVDSITAKGTLTKCLDA